jgi:cobyrinic acid a,c-diamide synthase
MIAAARSGAGKTTVTLGLLAAWRRRGVVVRAAKSGPDYIDPAFHAAACGAPGVNLDSWAMPPPLLDALLADLAAGADAVVIESAMGLFDGVDAPPGRTGAAADLAARFALPVVLVLDIAGQAQSAAAVARGFAAHRPDVRVAGVILNRVASARHRAMAAGAIEAIGLPVLGALPREPALAMPERHLGLVQAEELPRLRDHLSRLADAAEAHLDLAAILALAGPPRLASEPAATALPPPGQRICDVCWLPGGYPELHAGRLAAAAVFRAGLARFATTRPVHGECGGFMVLGQRLEDADGVWHPMTGLLGHATSFARRRLHLGYREARLRVDAPIGPAGGVVRGHEFHYATLMEAADGQPLADLIDGQGAALGGAGERRGRVTGTFFHAIAGVAA